jgi:catechol 2,3-dioxygenase-like lactoylglutathione lyase family enzyme
MGAITNELDHVSLAVDDLDAAVGFYEAAFGYELSFQDAQAEAIVALTGVAGLRCALAQLRHPAGGGALELVRFEGPAAEVDGIGRGHVAFRVRDLPAALGEVEALGAQPLGQKVRFPTGSAIYAREPGGSIFELYEPA